MIITFRNDKLLVEGEVEEIYEFSSHPRFKIKLRRYVSLLQDNKVYFSADLHYSLIDNVIEEVKLISDKRNLEVIIDDRIYEYVNEQDSYIRHKYTIGNDIKNKEENYKEYFDEYNKILDLNMSRKLRIQQSWDSFYMTFLQKTGNFSVPGSGKTSSVYGMYAYLRYKEKVKRIVMIGPKNSFISWIDEYKNCFGREPDSILDIQDYDVIKDKKRAILYDSGGVELVLLNYEILPSVEEELTELIDSETLLVFDEVHKIKNVKGIRAQSALLISKSSKYLVGLTGTPLPNGYQDIFNFLNLIYPKDYNNFFGFTLPTLKDPTDTEKEMINDRIQPFFCRTTKNDLGVPKPNEDILINVDANKNMNDIFYILANKYKKNALTFFIRVLQLESNPKMLLKSIDTAEYAKILEIYNPNVEEVDYVDYSSEMLALINQNENTDKLDALLDIVKRLILDGKNLIVWCIFIDSMKSILHELNERDISCAIISGETKYDDRIRIINQFRMGKIQVLISNPHTLAESVSLHKNCHDAIYYEYSYNLVHLLQSKDRIHRLGLLDTDYTQYYFLQISFQFNNETFSLSGKVYERLSEKEKIMIDAIDNHKLEILPTDDEDIEFLFDKVLK